MTVRTKHERLEPLLFRVQLQDTSHRVQKWNVGPEYRKRLEQPCGYFGKRTPFLRWRVQLQGYEGERSGLKHWTETTEGTENVLRTFWEVDVSPVSPSSTSGYEEKRLEANTVRSFDVSGQNDRADKTRKA